jgi:hypothetical protein
VIRFELPEETLPPTHRARVLWEVVGTLDLGKFVRGVKAVEADRPRKTLSPRMKVVLWLYAISTGVGSARRSRGSSGATMRTAGSSAISRSVTTRCRRFASTTVRRSTS